ncbi:MAG: DeoR/GlpR family DNA-binding transcription regulator [Christensenellales bacterium]
MKISRINEIERYLMDNKFASITDLCEHFSVSQNTIRRDIADLCSRGIAEKVYGGIVLRDGHNVVPYNMRSVSNIDEKNELARLASRYIQDGETIYIDSGTTTPYLMRFIPQDCHITIISNSLNIYNESEQLPNANVISTGGLFYRYTNSFIGVSAISMLSNYHITKAFMAATGITIETGATNNSFHEAEMKKAVVNRCNKIILMADSTKVDKAASISFCPLKSLFAFVTDKKPPRHYIDYFDQNNIELLFGN